MSGTLLLLMRPAQQSKLSRQLTTSYTVQISIRNAYNDKWVCIVVARNYSKSNVYMVLHTSNTSPDSLLEYLIAMLSGV